MDVLLCASQSVPNKREMEALNSCCGHQHYAVHLLHLNLPITAICLWLLTAAKGQAGLLACVEVSRVKTSECWEVIMVKCWIRRLLVTGCSTWLMCLTGVQESVINMVSGFRESLKTYRNCNLSRVHDTPVSTILFFIMIIYKTRVLPVTNGLRL